MDVIYFYPSEGGTWRGKAWTGDRYVLWLQIFMTKDEAEIFAKRKKCRAVFLVE